MPWFRAEIRFLEKIPSDKDLIKINYILQDLDYDLPRMNEQGMLGDWRHPTVSLRAVLNVIQIMGFQCKGRKVLEDMILDEDEDIEELLENEIWLFSEEDLSTLSTRAAQSLCSRHSRFRRFVPKSMRDNNKGRRRRRKRSTRRRA